MGRAQTAVERSGVDATIVDVGCLAPLDDDGLLEQAKATGKIVVAHGSCPAVAGELCALIADKAILYLDAPVTRVGGDPRPLTGPDEAAALPTVERLVEALIHVAQY